MSDLLPQSRKTLEPVPEIWLLMCSQLEYVCLIEEAHFWINLVTSHDLSRCSCIWHRWLESNFCFMPVTQRTAPISVYVCVAGGNHSIGSCNRFACIDYCVDSDPLINVSARVTTASGKLRAASITQSIMAAIAQLQNTKMPLALVHAAWVNRSNRTTTNVHGTAKT